MKISTQIKDLGEKYPNKLKIIKKGIFWILLDEQAFWMSKEFDLKITKLDKETIKVGFPDSSKQKWLKLFETKSIGYVLFESKEEVLVEVGKFNGVQKIFDIDIENFDLTKKKNFVINICLNGTKNRKKLFTKR